MYTATNEPPCLPSSYGNFQRLPNPIEEPIAASKKAVYEPQPRLDVLVDFKPAVDLMYLETLINSKCFMALLKPHWVRLEKGLPLSNFHERLLVITTCFQLYTVPNLKSCRKRL